MTSILSSFNSFVLSLYYTSYIVLLFSPSPDVVGGGEADPCSPNPCKNGGICQIVGGTFKCTCTAGFFGPTCSGMLLIPIE